MSCSMPAVPWPGELISSSHEEALYKEKLGER